MKKEFVKIAVTMPDAIPHEAISIMEKLREEEYDILHLRKPEWDIDRYELLLRAIPADLHPKIVLHSFFDLALKYNVRGIHLNRRFPTLLPRYSGKVSRSCHTIEEVLINKRRYDYVFLSPVFDSISKIGYKAAFSPEQLKDYGAQGVFDDNVIALGGVTHDKLDLLKSWGFAGAAMLGDVWKN